MWPQMPLYASPAPLHGAAEEGAQSGGRIRHGVEAHSLNTGHLPHWWVKAGTAVRKAKLAACSCLLLPSLLHEA